MLAAMRRASLRIRQIARQAINGGRTSVIKFISYEPALGPLRLPKHGPVPDWLISGGESGGGARLLDPQWVRDIIADCRRRGVVPFHKQWGTYANNPLVVEQGMTTAPQSVPSAQSRAAHAARRRQLAC